MADLGKAGENLKKVGDNLKGITESASFTEDALKSVAATIQEAIQTAVEKMDDLDSISKKVAKSYERDIVNGIKKLGPSLEKSTSIQLKLLQGLDAAKEIEQEMQSALAQKLVLEQRLQRLKDRGVLSSEEILQLEGEIADITGYINNELQNQADSNQSIIDSLGIVGNTLSGINAIAPKFAKALNADKIEKDMAKAVGQARALNKELTRSQVIGIGLQSAFSNLKKPLTDPAVIFTTLYKSATQVSQEVTNLQRATGMSYGNATALNAELRMTAQTSGQIQISTAKLHEAFAAITSELGVSADILGGEALISMSNLTKKIGLGAKEATQLTLMSRLQGKNTEETLSSTVDVVNNLNKQNKTAINFKGVLSDVANSSKTLQVSLAANPEALTEAAFEAKKLGLSLNALEGIADNLLNFESSIQAEMEAELLTGKQINLEKAREAALNNDMVGLSKEIGNNQEIASAFASGNRIEQQAIAKAMGMSKDQLADMYYQQELNKLSAEEFKERYGEAAYEQAKASSASEKFGYTLDRVKEIIGNIGMALAPVLDLVAGILSKWYILYPLMGLVALSYVPKLAKGAKDFAGNIKSGFDSIKGIAKGVKDAVTGKSGMVQAKSGKFFDKDSPQGKMIRTKGGTQALDGAGKGAEGLGKSADQTKNVKGNKGEDIKNFIIGLVDGLKYAGENFGMVVAGGGALLLSTPGLIGLGIASPGLYIISKINGESFSNAMQGIANGIIAFGNNFGKLMIGTVALGAVGLVLSGAFALAMMMVKDIDPVQMIAFAGSLTMLGLTMALLGNIGANVIMGAVAMGILALSLIPAAFAFSLLAGVDVGAMVAFSIALPLLALAAAGLGFLAPFIIFGSIALAALGTALIPAAEAFGNLAGVDVGSISAFSAGIYDLASSVAGLGFLAPAIAFGGVALAMLGASLEVLSIGFGALESVDAGALISGLTGLASLGPGLMETASALFAVAGGMGAFALTGFLALPVIGALTALGAVSEGLGSIFGGGGEEKSDEGSMKAIEQKLDQLIAVVSEGGDVYIDGSKVGKTLQLASSKMG